MKSFQATASSNLGITQANSYIYSFATTSAQADSRTNTYTPLSSTDRLGAICSDDSLRIFDPSTLQILPDGLISKVNNGVTSIKRFGTNGQPCSIFVTTGRDGRVCGWDLRSKKRAFELRAPKGQPLSALDGNFELNAVVAGMEYEGIGVGDVSIFGWDVRKPGEIQMTYSESHTDTITELRFIPHAKSSSLLLSASTDGLVNIFDTSIPEEDDALYQVINHHSALHHAGLMDNDLYALGTDEKMSIYAFPDPDPEVTQAPPFVLGDVRETLGCEYVVNVLQAGNKSVIAAGNHSEHWLDLINLNNAADKSSDRRNWEWRADNDNRVRLVGGHGEEVVRDVFVSEGANVVFTCGEDGMVRQWKGQQDGDVEMDGTKSAKRRHEGDKIKKEKRSKRDG
ncbi:WD40 repeat-like protein [Venturia nashicola]|uniref:WD40 repeat-like protein n=1 Tax=Venturia nashicola TaxID=86259 RepID=A0A4Z1P3R4_9PEZI|nr:WD40 repeat-like protein [Venturia nashicola]